MFSERLENLIKSALQDGVLTDQEKNAIVKRAQAEGEDIDEVDIYIQSLMQKRQQELNAQASDAAANERKARKKAEDAATLAEKERNKSLRKCPKCGSFIPALKNICPECGHVIKTADSTADMQDMISFLETSFKDLKWDWGKWKEGWVFASLESLKALEKKGYVNKVKAEKDSLSGTDLTNAYYCYFPIKSKLKNLYGEEPTVKSYLEELHKKECFQKLADAIDNEPYDHLKQLRRELEFNYSDLNIAPLLAQIDKKLNGFSFSRLMSFLGF